jgi:hypothetical protein
MIAFHRKHTRVTPSRLQARFGPARARPHPRHLSVEISDEACQFLDFDSQSFSLPEQDLDTPCVIYFAGALFIQELANLAKGEPESLSEPDHFGLTKIVLGENLVGVPSPLCAQGWSQQVSPYVKAHGVDAHAASLSKF